MPPLHRAARGIPQPVDGQRPGGRRDLQQAFTKELFGRVLLARSDPAAIGDFMAAQADEPLECNFVRKHALEYQQKHNCDLETAALRVFGNAEGTYGANVGNLIESSRWSDEDEIAETYTRRKCFAYGRAGTPLKHPALLSSVLKDVELTYQNLDSVEVGVTTIDVYFDTLGGIATAAKRAAGGPLANQRARRSIANRAEGSLRHVRLIVMTHER